MSIESLNEKLLKGSKKNEKFFVAVVPVSEAGEVLLGKRTEDGIWTTPGGGSEPGEEPHQAARRELFEEAGLAASPNALELVSITETPRGFKLYAFLWRMPRMLAEIATPKLDPDKEVKSWKLYRPEEFPPAMASEQNASRLKTIREVLMKLYGITKADKIPGGLADNKTPEDFDAKALAAGVKVEMEHTSDEKIAREIAMDHLSEDPQYYTKLKLVEKSDEEIVALTEKLTKAGTFEESKHHRATDGKFGEGGAHRVSAKQPSAAHPHVDSDIAKPVNKIQAHLTSLEHGKVMPGLTTQSGKPVANDMGVARAHGYDIQDHVDAMNAHYELAQKTQAMLEKFKMAGHKVPTEGAKIAQFHQKKMKEHMKARQYLEERREHTEAALKEKKSVRKSVTQMGSGLGDRDIDTGSFAQSNGNGSAEWMEKLYSGMQGYSFGDDPRQFMTDAGTLTITKIDDGIYSGFFTKHEDGMLDNARVRIERQTIPELVQFMIAKEWIKNHVVEEAKSQPQEPTPVDPVTAAGLNYAAGMDFYADKIAEQEREYDLRALNHALLNPQDVPPNGPMAQKIRILELIAKLTS